MLAVVTRVREARVDIGGRTHGAIGRGFLVLLGVHRDDGEADALYTADRLCGLRVFADESGKMNLSAQTANAAEILLISQFTLFGDLSQRRPYFADAARPEVAVPLYERVAELCRARGFRVETGEFGANMQVYSVNDGPVTLLIDSGKR